VRIALFTFGLEITLTGDLSAAAIGTAYARTLTASGSESPWRIQVESTDLPGWGTTASEWTITDNGDGTVDVESPDVATAGEYFIDFLVQDGLQNTVRVRRTLSVIALPLLISGVLDDATVGTPYSDTLTVTGGIPPYSLILAYSVPDGIVPSLAGGTASPLTLAGTPTGVGLGPGTAVVVPISVSVEDTSDPPKVYTFEQNVTVNVDALQLTGTLNDAQEGVPYADSLTRAGGIGDVAVTAQSDLPGGVTATADNPNDQVDVAGTPAAGSAALSPWAPSITITDDEGNVAVWNGSLVVGVPTPWTPAHLVVAPKQWLNDTSNYGGASAQWDDLSANAFHVISPSAGTNPIVNATGLNGLRTIEFSTTTTPDRLGQPAGHSQAGAVFRNVAAAWVFVIYRKRSSDAGTANRPLILGLDNDGDTRFALRCGSSTGAGNLPQLVATRLDADAAGALNATTNNGLNWQMVLAYADYSTRAGAIHINGALDASTATLTAAAGNTSNTVANSGTPGAQIFVLATNSTGSISSNVEIAEVIIGSGSLPSPTEIDKLFGYGGHKWALTSVLPALHPYKTTPPYV
jgi:hypothetical protein